MAHFFEDPDGRIELPHALKVDFWKRPQDFIVDAVIKQLFILQCLCWRIVQVLVSESETEIYFFDPYKYTKSNLKCNDFGSEDPIKTSLVANIRATFTYNFFLSIL